MSGGYFGYSEISLLGIQEQLQQVIEHNNSTEKNEWGLGRNYPPEIIKVFQEAQQLVEKTYLYLHEIDYLLSDDTGPETFLENLKKAAN